MTHRLTLGIRVLTMVSIAGGFAPPAHGRGAGAGASPLRTGPNASFDRLDRGRACRYWRSDASVGLSLLGGPPPQACLAGDSGALEARIAAREAELATCWAELQAATTALWTCQGERSTCATAVGIEQDLVEPQGRRGKQPCAARGECSLTGASIDTTPESTTPVTLPGVEDGTPCSVIVYVLRTRPRQHMACQLPRRLRRLLR